MIFARLVTSARFQVSSFSVKDRGGYMAKDLAVAGYRRWALQIARLSEEEVKLPFPDRTTVAVFP